MRVLLDTRVLIWWDEGQRLSADAVRAIHAADEVFVSAVSAWEVAIKGALGKVTSTRSVALAASESGFIELPTTFSHAEQLSQLPPLHRDPFDRMLVAQAIVERCAVVTRNPMFARYGVDVIVA